MSEKTVIEQSRMPVTVSGMEKDFARLGVRDGDVVIVHSSLSKLGWVCGGSQAVIQALLRTIGAEGTLVMPAHSGNWSDPAGWQNPPVPTEWIDTIYDEMPAFDPETTPTRGMGQIPELFRSFPGTMRSTHPQVSFCANGKLAADIVAEHPLTPQFGMDSPLGKLYKLDAKALLIGVGYDSCTSFHLAEATLPAMPVKKMGTAMMEDGKRVWKRFADFAYDADDFNILGAHYELERDVRRGKVGQAESALFDVRSAVDYAGSWLDKQRF